MVRFVSRTPVTVARGVRCEIYRPIAHRTKQSLALPGMECSIVGPADSQCHRELEAIRSTDSYVLRVDIERQVCPVALHAPSQPPRRVHRSSSIYNQDKPESCPDRIQLKDGWEAFDFDSPADR
jgi:hypothetical protein